MYERHMYMSLMQKCDLKSSWERLRKFHPWVIIPGGYPEHEDMFMSLLIS